MKYWPGLWRLCVRSGVACSSLPFLCSQLGAHSFDFAFQGEVFGFLAGEVGAGEAQFGGGAFGGEQVEVGELVVVAAEVVGFDEAFFEQGFEQVVGLAQADAQPLGQLALVEAGFGGDDVEDAQLRLFLGCHFLYVHHLNVSLPGWGVEFKGVGFNLDVYWNACVCGSGRPRRECGLENRGQPPSQPSPASGGRGDRLPSRLQEGIEGRAGAAPW